MVRLSTSGLMGIVAVVALGLAAMRDGSDLACAVAMGALFLTLLVASLGAVVRPSPAAPWRGFALFGWVYAASTFVRPDLGWGTDDPLPFGAAIQWTADRLHPAPSQPPKPTNPIVLGIRFDQDGQTSLRGPSPSGLPTTAEVEEARRYQDARTAYTDAVMSRGKRLVRATRIGHASLALSFGLIGLIIGRSLAPGPIADQPALVEQSSSHGAGSEDRKLEAQAAVLKGWASPTEPNSILATRTGNAS